MPDYIEWTKEFQVQHQKGFFKIYISCHKNKQMYGGIVYYEKTGSIAKNDATLNLKLHTILGKDEASLLELCKKWINENLGPDYQISEK